MEMPTVTSAAHQGATSTAPFAAPGSPFGKMLQRGVTPVTPTPKDAELSSSIPAPVGIPRHLRLSLLGADGFLVVLVIVFLAHTPLQTMFWREWLLGLLGLAMGGWLGWLSCSLD